MTCASRASSAGGRSSARVFTRSRAHICDSAITSPRRIASFAPLVAFASALPAPRTADLAQASIRVVRLGLVAVEPVGAEQQALHGRLDRLELVLAPTICGSVVTVLRRASCRATRPIARRHASGLAASFGPTPTSRTAFAAGASSPVVGTRRDSPSLPAPVAENCPSRSSPSRP